MISIQTNHLPNSIRTIYRFSKWLTVTSTRPKSTTTTTTSTTTVGGSDGIGGSVVVAVVVVVIVVVVAAVLSTVQFISHQTFRSLALFHSFYGVTLFLHSLVKAYFRVQKSTPCWASC